MCGLLCNESAAELFEGLLSDSSVQPGLRSPGLQE